MATQEYKPTPGDRDGFTFKCTDPTHPDWRSVSVDDVEKTSDIILPSCMFFEWYYPYNNAPFVDDVEKPPKKSFPAVSCGWRVWWVCAVR